MGQKLTQYLSKGRSWRLIAWAAILAYLVILGLYFYSFGSYGRSSSPEVWGAFGDYMGGVMGPVLGLLTILLLVQTLRQTDDALAQSREELELTRTELKRGLDIQQKTEQALAEQIDISRGRNDFDAAVTLFKYYEQREGELNDRLFRWDGEKKVGLSDIDAPGVRDEWLQVRAIQRKLSAILQSESERLVNKYSG